MRETYKVALIAFITVILTITVWNAGDLYFSQSCDPKFGCFGVFMLLTYIVSICATITALSLSIAHYVFAVSHKASLKNTELRIIVIFCFVVSIVSSNAISLAEDIGITLLINVWVAISFIVGALVFKYGHKT